VKSIKHLKSGARYERLGTLVYNDNAEGTSILFQAVI
jgi:hypothetical protein